MEKSKYEIIRVIGDHFLAHVFEHHIQDGNDGKQGWTVFKLICEEKNGLEPSYMLILRWDGGGHRRYSIPDCYRRKSKGKFDDYFRGVGKVEAPNYSSNDSEEVISAIFHFPPNQKQGGR